MGSGRPCRGPALQRGRPSHVAFATRGVGRPRFHARLASGLRAAHGSPGCSGGRSARARTQQRDGPFVPAQSHRQLQRVDSLPKGKSKCSQEPSLWQPLAENVTFRFPEVTCLNTGKNRKQNRRRVRSTDFCGRTRHVNAVRSFLLFWSERCCISIRAHGKGQSYSSSCVWPPNPFASGGRCQESSRSAPAWEQQAGTARRASFGLVCGRPQGPARCPPSGGSSNRMGPPCVGRVGATRLHTSLLNLHEDP